MRRLNEKAHAERLRGQFARVVKGVDLRSTGGNSAWVRTLQLTQPSGHAQLARCFETIDGSERARLSDSAREGKSINHFEREMLGRRTRIVPS